LVEIEKNKRLTDSALWELQHLAYTQFGPDAWGKKGVPFYLTSNPLIAKQFSACIVGFLRDLNEKGSLEKTEPFYIFYLGAGSGRLGFLILKTLIPDIREVISPDLKICYVMTDMVENNLEFLEKHAYLREFIESSNLDFAYYHHSHSSPLELRRKGVLDEKSVVNPIALVCTYYFDTVPQDLFRAKDGKLEEGRITLTLPTGSKIDRKKLSPEMISTLESTFDYIPIVESAYYAESPEINSLLHEYVKLFNNTPFLFPIGGLRSIQYFSTLSKGRLLLLAGDQGVSTEAQVREWGEPKIFKHASFSMAVSYHLLDMYFQKQGGFGLLTNFPNPKYVVMGGILGGMERDFPNVRLAFRNDMDFLEPVEYWELTNLKQEHLADFPLGQLLLYVKLGNWDPVNFHFFYNEIIKKLDNATAIEKDHLRKAIFHVWNNFYPVNPQEGDFVMNLGVLLFKLNHFEEALFLFSKAREISGDRIDLLMNIAHCYRMLGNQNESQQYIQKSIALKATKIIQDK
jgi:tetratricopeptide (TPR) repeat protein